MPGHVISKADWLAQYTDDVPIIGVDEVGRGCWAGPVMVGVLCLRASDYDWSKRLADSKAVTPTRRYALMAEMSASHAPFEIGSVDNHEIDRVGIDEATVRAAQHALRRLWVPSLRSVPVVLDGTPRSWPYLEKFLEKRFDNWYYLEKGDAIEPAVSGASILAKCTRDTMMVEEATLDNNRWDFRHNKGYGNGRARELLMQHGMSYLHRHSFRPMRDIFNG